jgi:hypothetical protein
MAASLKFLGENFKYLSIRFYGELKKAFSLVVTQSLADFWAFFNRISRLFDMLALYFSRVFEILSYFFQISIYSNSEFGVHHVSLKIARYTLFQRTLLVTFHIIHTAPPFLKTTYFE